MRHLQILLRIMRQYPPSDPCPPYVTSQWGGRVPPHAKISIDNPDTTRQKKTLHQTDENFDKGVFNFNDFSQVGEYVGKIKS